MSAERRRAAAREVKYVVVPDPANPVLLARVRWPDVFQAVSAAEPGWRSDPGLFDLPYDPSSHVVSYDEAAAIATEWGVEIPAADEGAVAGPTLIRRMPANWSELSPAVKRAWWIEPRRVRRRATADGSRWGRRRRRAASANAAASDELIVLTEVDPADVIDLTDPQEVDNLATVEDA